MTTEGSIVAEVTRADQEEAEEKQQKNDNDEKVKVRSLIYNLSNEKSDEVVLYIYVFSLKEMTDWTR